MPWGALVARVARRRQREQKGELLGFKIHVINRRKPMGHAMCFPGAAHYREIPESNAR